MPTNYEDPNNIRNLQLTRAQAQYVSGLGLFSPPETAYDPDDFAGERYGQGQILWTGDGSMPETAKALTPGGKIGEYPIDYGILGGYCIKATINASAMGLNVGDTFVYNGVEKGIPPVITLSNMPFNTNYFRTTEAEIPFEVVDNNTAVAAVNGKPIIYQRKTKFPTFAQNVEGVLYQGISGMLSEDYQEISAWYDDGFLNTNTVKLYRSNGLGYTKEEMADFINNFDFDNDPPISHLEVIYHTKRCRDYMPYMPYGDTNSEIIATTNSLIDFASQQKCRCYLTILYQLCTTYAHNAADPDLYWIKLQTGPCGNFSELPDGCIFGYIRSRHKQAGRTGYNDMLLRNQDLTWFNPATMQEELLSMTANDFEYNGPYDPDICWYDFSH